jgi:hypothetical protein
MLEVIIRKVEEIFQCASGVFPDHPEQFDFRPHGTTFVEEYAKFIAPKNEILDSAGQLIRPFLTKEPNQS